MLYHSTRRAVPERSWVHSLLPTMEVEPGFSTFGGMLVRVPHLISPMCKTGTTLFLTRHVVFISHIRHKHMISIFQAQACYKSRRAAGSRVRRQIEYLVLMRVRTRYSSNRQTAGGTCPRFPFAAVNVHSGPYLTIVERFAEHFATFEDASDSVLPNSCSNA
jgi:hypothetical protein